MEIEKKSGRNNEMKLSVLQWKQNNGFIAQNRYSNNKVESTVVLMILLQKYPFLHKFVDEEKKCDVLEKAMNTEFRRHFVWSLFCH